jgi:SAM-dependent methyltransferase
VNIKAKDNLARVWNQMADLITTNSKVIEIGCGSGNLLLALSPKIRSGLGIDISKTRIRQAKRKQISNVAFQCKPAGEHFRLPEKYDFSIASLFFHVIPRSEALQLLEKMREVSDTLLICAFTPPGKLRHKFVLWLDQRFSGHYTNFMSYKNKGYMEGILAEMQFSDIISYDTDIPYIKIYWIA